MKDNKKALALIKRAHSMEIVNQAQYMEAVDIYSVLRQKADEIKTEHDEMCEATHRAWKKACEQRTNHLDPYLNAIKAIKDMIGAWKIKQEAERKAKEREAYEKAVQEEMDKRKAEAEQNPEEAQQILNEPINVAPVIIPEAKIVGSPRFRTIWNAEVFDLSLLIQAVANKMVDEQALLPNETYLRKQAEALMERLNIPGVRSYSRIV